MPRRLQTCWSKLTPERYAEIEEEMRAEAAAAAAEGFENGAAAMAEEGGQPVAEEGGQPMAEAAEAAATAEAAAGGQAATLAEEQGGEATAAPLYVPMTLEEELAHFDFEMLIEPFLEEHYAAERQIADEQVDNALIGQMLQDAELLALNHAILESLQAPAGEDGDDEDGGDDSSDFDWSDGDEDVEMLPASQEEAAVEDVDMFFDISEKVDGPAAAVNISSSDDEE